MAVTTDPRPDDVTIPALPAAPEDLRLDANRRGSMVLGVMLGTAADVMALAGLLGAYIALRSLRHPFPPEGFRLPTYLPAMITVTAVMVSFSAAWALWAVRRN